jgi:hypothetical protein
MRMQNAARRRSRKHPALKMASKSKKSVPAVVRHKDGSLWAQGSTLDSVQVGYWEWFRKDGTKLRSGHFIDGRQTGERTTYDKRGQVYKITTIKPKARKS